MWPFRQKSIPVAAIDYSVITSALRAQRDLYREGWNDGFDAGRNWIGSGTVQIPASKLYSNKLAYLEAIEKKVSFPDNL